MAVDQDHIAENIRRMAGLHDRSLAELATWAGMSRAGMMKLVVREPAKRSYPKPATAIKLAQAFGVTLNDLYEEPRIALMAAVEALDDAPIEHENVEPLHRSTRRKRTSRQKDSRS